MYNIGNKDLFIVCLISGIMFYFGMSFIEHMAVLRECGVK